MDALSRRILSAFDEAGSEILTRSSLIEFAAENALAKREEALRALEMLARGDYLDNSSGRDSYRRSEQGRLAVAAPRDATLYTRPGCHLCDAARAAIAPILREIGANLREVNIEEDADLCELYTNDVPVVFLGSREVARHRVDAARFRRALEEAKS
jgi:glutaredoxin